MDDRTLCRVWQNPAGCKIITLTDAVRKGFFASYDADPTKVPPSGIYQVRASSLPVLAVGGDVWYAVDFAGLRGDTRSRNTISEELAMRLAPLKGGVGDIDVGGCALGRFAFALPTSLATTLAECIVGHVHGGQLGSRVTQQPTTVASMGQVVRKKVALTWFGGAHARVAREVRRWFGAYALHPVGDLLYMATCREWRPAPSSHPDLELTLRASVQGGRTALTLSQASGAFDVAVPPLSGSELTLLDACTGERETVTVSLAKVYRVNGKKRLHVEVFPPLQRGYTKGIKVGLRAALRYECVDAVNVVHELQHEFMSQLLRNRVLVVSHGKVLTHTVDFATLTSIAVAFWTVCVVQHSVRRKAVHHELRAHVPTQDPTTVGGGNKTVKVLRPKCVQQASLRRDGPLKHGLRLDIASIEMLVHKASGKSLATSRYMAQLVSAGKFRADRVETLKTVIAADQKRRHKEFGVTSCSRRRQPSVSSKLRCPYESTLECCRVLGYTDLNEAHKVYGFSPVDVALGYKTARPLLYEADDGCSAAAPYQQALHYTHALASIKN